MTDRARALISEARAKVGRRGDGGSPLGAGSIPKPRVLNTRSVPVDRGTLTINELDNGGARLVAWDADSETRAVVELAPEAIDTAIELLARARNQPTLFAVDVDPAAEASG